MRKFLSILMVIVSLVILASCEGILPGGTHTHDFSGEYKYDDTYHWHICECGEKETTEAHIWNDGEITIAPTEDAVGEKTYTCTVCGQTKKEEVAKVDSVVIEEINISGKIYNISPNKDSLSWNDAKFYCDTLTLEGIDDWYLPEVSEVSAIFKNKGELSNIKTEDYWTNNENYLSALVVYFGTGQTFYFDNFGRSARR